MQQTRKEKGGSRRVAALGEGGGRATNTVGGEPKKVADVRSEELREKTRDTCGQQEVGRPTDGANLDHHLDREVGETSIPTRAT